MANKTLYQAREFGIKGEAFINKHLHEFITDNLLLNLEDTSGKNVEGMDSTSFSAKLGASAPEFIPDFADPGDQPAYPITAITYGGNEIKTINSFLWRTNDGEDPTGTLGFELWETDSKRHYGWAYKIFHPEKSMNAVQPAYLFFLLVAYGSAFACVAFEDIDKLHARLANVAHEDGFDIDEYPLGREMNIPSIVGNMWQVPLSRIEDLAVVTLIGNKPRIRPDIIAGTQKCSKRTQNQRYDHLVQLASGRSIDSDPQFVGIILADGADHRGNTLFFVVGADTIDHFPVVFGHFRDSVGLGDFRSQFFVPFFGMDHEAVAVHLVGLVIEFDVCHNNFF